MAINGSSVLLLINVAGSDEPALFVPIGSQLGMQKQTNRELISAAHKNSPYTRSLYGRHSSNVTIDALFVPDEESQNHLEEAQRQERDVLVRVQREDGAVEQAWALIVSIGEGHPDNDRSTLAVELQIENDWEVV